MPELPEVETVRRGLAQAMTGATFTTVDQHRPDLRFPFPERFAERLTGRRIENVGRRAKYLVLDLDEGLVLAAHLGMTGSFRVSAGVRETVPGRYYHERGGRRRRRGLRAGRAVARQPARPRALRPR